MKLAAVLEAAAAELAAVGVPSPQNDAEVIMAHALGISRGSLLAKVFKGDDLSGDPLRQFAQMIDRRMSREPLQHIVGLAPFLDFELKVGPGVFIPRPETEMLTEMAVAELGTGSQQLVVDVGTGSGAIAIGIARARPNASVIAVESSLPAAEFARQNIADLAPAVTLKVADFEVILLQLQGKCDLIVSNPPYIPADAEPTEPEVSQYDPPEALYGGEDGLDVIRKLERFAWFSLKPGGMLLLEHGFDQSQQIRDILGNSGWQQLQSHNDLAGKMRFTSARR
jgi:release factor glutamine methyltransferase